MKKKESKLQLHRETVRTLQDPHLQEVLGGVTAGCGSNNTCGGSLVQVCQTCHVH